MKHSMKNGLLRLFCLSVLGISAFVLTTLGSSFNAPSAHANSIVKLDNFTVHCLPAGSSYGDICDSGKIYVTNSRGDSGPYNGSTVDHSCVDKGTSRYSCTSFSTKREVICLRIESTESSYDCRKKTSSNTDASQQVAEGDTPDLVIAQVDGCPDTGCDAVLPESSDLDIVLAQSVTPTDVNGTSTDQTDPNA